MLLKLNSHESNSIACWGVEDSAVRKTNYIEYPCNIIRINEVNSVDLGIDEFAHCSIFNVSHKPEKSSRLNSLKWQKKWDNKWLEKESENISIDSNESSVFVNVLRLERFSLQDIFNILGDVKTSFAVLHKHDVLNEIINSLNKSIIVKEFSSVDYPTLLNGLSSNEYCIIRKCNYPEESLILISC